MEFRLKNHILLIALLFSAGLVRAQKTAKFVNDTTNIHFTILSAGSAYHCDQGKVQNIPLGKPVPVNIRTKFLLNNMSKFCVPIFKLDNMATTHQLMNRFNISKKFYRQPKFNFKQWHKDTSFISTYFKEKGTSKSDQRLFYYAVCQSWTGYGIARHTDGDFVLALEYLQLVHKILKQNFEENLALAASYNNIGSIWQENGNLLDAELYLDTSLQLLKKLNMDDSKFGAIVLNNKSVVAFKLGHEKQSHELIKQATNLANSTFLPNSIDFEHLALNKVLLSKGLINENISAYDAILKSFEKKIGKFHSGYTNALNNAAYEYFKNGQPVEALEMLDESAYVNKRLFGLDHIRYARSLKKIALLYQELGFYDRAKPLWEIIVGTQGKSLGLVHPEYNDSKFHYAVCIWKTGDSWEAWKRFKEVNNVYLSYVNDLFPYLAEQEKEKVWARMQLNFNEFFRFALANREQYQDLNNEMFDIRIRTKGILLSSTKSVRQSIQNIGSEEQKDLYDNWSKKKQALALAYTMSVSAREEEGIDTKKLEEEIYSLEKKLFRSVDSNTVKTISAINFKDIKNSLRSNEAFVEILHVPYHNDKDVYIGMIVKKEAERPILVQIGTALELEGRGFKYYKNTVAYQVPDKKSYRRYWSAMDEDLKSVEKIYYSPDGIYHKLNVLTLYDTESKKHLIEFADIASISSVDEFMNRNRTFQKNLVKKTALLFGNPAFGDAGTVVPLPGTKKEVDAIQKLLEQSNFPSQEFIAGNATEEKVKNSKHPTVLHIATHGFFVESEEDDNVLQEEMSTSKTNPMLRSGLLMANAESYFEDKSAQWQRDNGVLTAMEAASLDLSGTGIVVLSACETGGGEIKNGEGVYGLQRAFMEAGTQNLVISLWKVDDQATMELMVDFYKKQIEEVSYRDAFRQAQLELKKKYPEPYYWGAFVFIGI